MQSTVINFTLFGALYYLLLADDDEEEASVQKEGSKGDDKWTLAKVGQEVTEDEGESRGAEEDDEEVLVPDTIPEDAYFIPLGFARRRPQTYYKGSDPEWQGFIEFSKDRKRCMAIRSKLWLEIRLHLCG